MGVPLSLDAIVGQAPNQVSCDLEGEAAILDIKTGTYYGLNQVGARVWELLHPPKRVAAILDGLSQRYAAPQDQLEADLFRLLEELRARGLVAVTGSAASAGTPSLT